MHDPHTTISNEEAFLQDFPVITTKKKSVFSTTCIVISLACSNFIPHNSVLFVTKRLRFEPATRNLHAHNTEKYFFKDFLTLLHWVTHYYVVENFTY